MIKKSEKKYEPLDNKKKDTLKSLANSANSEIDFNKVRDEWKREWDSVERPCTPAESLEESLLEMKKIREGKIPKESYWDMMEDFDNDDEVESQESTIHDWSHGCSRHATLIKALDEKVLEAIVECSKKYSKALKNLAKL